MEQEITQNARRGQRFSVCIHGVNDKGKIMRAAGGKFGDIIYAVKQLKNSFFAPAASYTFLSFTLVYRVLVAMHKTHFDLFWPAAAKKIGFKYNKNSWKVGELTRISGDFFRKKVNSPGLSETGNLNSPPKLIPL